MPEHTRPAAVAGQFYPADSAELGATVNAMLAQAAAQIPADEPVPKALIAPHAGYIYSGPVAASAYARLASLKGRIEKVVLLGPSHRVGFKGIATCSAAAYASPLGDVPIDRATLDRLALMPEVGELDAAHAQEHSLEVHLPFLQAVLGSFRLVPLVVGDASPALVAAALDSCWGGPETLIVISTDLSHYLDYETCRAIDAKSVAAIEALNFNGLGRDQACGRVPVGGLLDCAKRRGMHIKTLDVRNSGDTAGGRGRVVGYGAWALYEAKAGERVEEDGEAAIRAAAPALRDLAWASIRSGFSTGRPKAVAFAPGMPAILGRPGAVFVTLKRAGQLRGCIGSVMAWRSLIEDVADNAFKSAFKDPRFPPLRPDEAEGLDMSISVLTPPLPMSFADEADLLAQLRSRIDGLVIEDGGRRALFLPSVWEQLPDKHRFIAHLKQKAGLAPDHWSVGFKASRFQAIEI